MMDWKAQAEQEAQWYLKDLTLKEQVLLTEGWGQEILLAEKMNHTKPSLLVIYILKF